VATFERFEDILAWQKARELTRAISEDADKGPFSRNLRFSGQITDSACSIMSNIAEGFERGGRKEFIQFLWIAKGSAGEFRSQLYVALDRNYISKERFEDLQRMVTEISRMLKGLISYLQRSPIEGIKRKPVSLKL
jgi:four helix bundle protein